MKNIGKKERYPSLTLYYVFKNLALVHGVVSNYQARQGRKGVLALHMEGTLAPQVSTLLIEEMEKYYGQDMDIQVIENANLKSDKGKRLDFISSINDE